MAAMATQPLPAAAAYETISGLTGTVWAEAPQRDVAHLAP